MRGEHHCDSQCPGRGFGSSPHARGTPQSAKRPMSVMRFIPACAGNTVLCPSQTPRCTVHPRMRGEHEEAEADFLAQAGSSPHARGTPVHRYCADDEIRFIPACAGNTCCPRAATPGATVHPRMRGEHASGTPPQNNQYGSSPHARGTPAVPTTASSRTRFIPACAGNTKDATPDELMAAVHPRMRGEHRPKFERRPTTDGSSPHARGTPRTRAG